MQILLGWFWLVKGSTAVQWMLLADTAWMEYPSWKICSARETGAEFVPQPQAGGLAGILKPVFIDIRQSSAEVHE